MQTLEQIKERLSVEDMFMLNFGFKDQTEPMDSADIELRKVSLIDSVGGFELDDDELDDLINWVNMHVDELVK